LRVIILGLGNIGKSLLKLITQKKIAFTEYGIYHKIVGVVDSKGAIVNKKGLEPDYILSLKDNKKTVSADPNFGLPGNGFHVITANKGPLALALPALMELAEYNDVKLRFSGSVGGGTPILDLGREGLLGNRINRIRGILNGTTNYILTRMATSNIILEDALDEAKNLGYAEADPSYDIEGIDSACKLVIIANWIMNIESSLHDVQIEGVSNVSLESIKEAEKKDMRVKLIASIEDSKLTTRPEPIPKSNPLCVNGTLNAVTFETEPAGDITISGKGAGGAETSSAIIRDLTKIRVESTKHVK
jgi:homoserine dehydrogenase